MSNYFRETTFGRIANLFSGGKVFGYDEKHDLDNFQKGVGVKSSTSSTLTTEGGNVNPEDPEKGVDNNNNNNNNTTKKSDGVQLVDWAENDPENPRNWSTLKKLFVTFQICLLTTSVYMGSAIFTAGIPGITEQFKVSEVKALVGLTLFVLGYALGPMIFAPMSEIPYIGRNAVYVGTLFAFVLLQLPVIYAKNYGMLMAFRFITGFVGSPVLATGGATIADIYVPQKQPYGIGVWGIAAVFGPALGPLFGGFASEAKGWTWTIWELMWLSGFCFIFLFFLLPETSASNILYRRTLRLRKLTGDTSLQSQAEIEAKNMTGREILQMGYILPFTLTFTEPICFFLNFYIALIYGLLYLWFESFPIVFVQIYHFSLGTEGLAFVGILLGAAIAMGPFFYYNYKYVEPQYNADGLLRPEVRLQPAMIGAFFIPICLFWFGWSARPSIHWIMPVIGSSFFSMGAFLLFMAVLSYLGDAYPKHIASVYAGNDLVRSSFGAAFPLFANAMYKKLGLAWASSLLGFCSIAFIPIPFVLYKYGKKIRSASKMARQDL